MKKLGLALGAGGSRGIAHVGFLKALEEEGIKPHFISGSSMGAVVGACYAGGMSPDEMMRIARKLKITKLIDLSVLPLKKGGIFRSKRFKEVIYKALPVKDYEHLKIPFCCVATDLDKGQTVVLDSGELYMNVAASSSMPVIFRPVKIDGLNLVDGGVLCRVPVKQARDMGADVVVGVDVLGQEKKGEDKYDTLGVVFRYIDVIDGEIARYHKNKYKADLYVEPYMNGMSQYKLKDIEVAYRAGYKSGKDNVEEIKKMLCD